MLTIIALYRSLSKLFLVSSDFIFQIRKYSANIKASAMYDTVKRRYLKNESEISLLKPRRNGYKKFPGHFEAIFGLSVNMVNLTLITQPISSVVNREFIVVQTFICKVLIYKLPLVET